MLTREEWINSYRSSSTLKRSMRLGGSFHELYIHERVAWEYGYHFDAVPSSRICTGAVIAEGDCPELTESQWLVESYLERNPTINGTFSYIVIYDKDSNIEKQGIGLVITSPTFLDGCGRKIFAITSEVKNNNYCPVKVI